MYIIVLFCFSMVFIFDLGIFPFKSNYLKLKLIQKTFNTQHMNICDFMAVVKIFMHQGLVSFQNSSIFRSESTLTIHPTSCTAHSLRKHVITHISCVSIDSFDSSDWDDMNVHVHLALTQWFTQLSQVRAFTAHSFHKMAGSIGVELLWPLTS